MEEIKQREMKYEEEIKKYEEVLMDKEWDEEIRKMDEEDEAMKKMWKEEDDNWEMTFY